MTSKLQTAINDVVWVDPGRMSGEPCFRGTRVPIQAFLDHVEGNCTMDEFLEGFPSVSREQAIRFLELAKDALLSNVCGSS